MKVFFAFFMTFLAVFSLAAGFVMFDIFKRQNLVLPRTVLGNISIAGLNREAVREKIESELTAFTKEPFLLAAAGDVKQVNLRELGVFLDIYGLMEDIPFAKTFSNWKILLWSFAGQRVTPKISVERTEILRVIDEKFPSIPKTRNASMRREGVKIKIVEGRTGMMPQVEPLLKQISRQVAFLEHQPAIITFQEVSPEISSADLEEYQTALFASLPEKITLFSEKQRWPVFFQKNPEWIHFQKKNYPLAAGEVPFALEWDPVEFSTFLREKEISSVLEQTPESVRIWKDEKDQIQIDGHGNAGRSIQKERLLTLINQAMAHGEKEVEIPLAVVPPILEVSAHLQAMGIRELLAVGHTRFEGSPVNRKHNIGVGVRRYNGLLIPPGETFSFNKNLGPVDDTTGYKKELVIKPEGTIPEFGGGLCQVSSTIYRAAIFAGLPIVERAPHSYAVRYYAQVGGHGLDATIYPPSRDLRFSNDTPGHILIQSYVDGTQAYFKFYGTSDGRKVEMEGPLISGKRAAPSEAILVPDIKLKPGQKKQVEKPHDGFDALWYRTITSGGKRVQEKITSRYKAVPAKYLVGGETGTAGDNQGFVEGINPFE